MKKIKKNPLKKGKIIKLLIPVVVFLLTVASLFTTGILSVAFAGALFTKAVGFLSSNGTSTENTITTITGYEQASDFLNLLDNGYEVHEQLLEQMRLTPETFRYIMEIVDTYNKRAVMTRTISIEGSSTDEEDPPEISVEVSNIFTEGMLQLDWRRVYLYALLASLDETFDSNMNYILNDRTEMPIVENNRAALISSSDIALAYNTIVMRYDYAFDVMTDSRTHYTYDECRSLPHTELEMDGVTYYCPTSLMNYAYSGHSRLLYNVDDNLNITGITEYYSYDMYHAIGPKISHYYSDALFKAYCKIIPGGSAVREQFDLYELSYKQGNNVIFQDFFSFAAGDYTLSKESYSADTSLPDISGNLITGTGPSNNGLIYTGDTLYPSPKTVGEAAVNLALSRLNWKYSQDMRMSNGYWDCSSMVGRVYSELGVSINPGSTTVTLLAEAKQLGQIIDISELTAGDVVYLSTSSGNGRHVIMYAGNGMCVHAKGKDYGTVYESLDACVLKSSKEVKIAFRPYYKRSSTWQPTYKDLVDSLPVTGT